MRLMATVRCIKGRLYYDFYFKRVRCTETSGLEAIRENRKKAAKYLKLITAEIDNGVSRYESHFPHGAKIELSAPRLEELPFNHQSPVVTLERYNSFVPNLPGKMARPYSRHHTGERYPVVKLKR
ncbi:MAG TPA: DUF3596 domain-containing protein [Desulfobaccales bacterium]